MSKVFHSFQDMCGSLQPNPNSFRESGVDHLSLSPYSGPIAARQMSLEWAAGTFQYPGLGKFAGARNLWFWLTTVGHPDIFREANSHDLQRLQHMTVQPNDRRRVYNKDQGKITNFHAIILTGKYLQLRKMHGFKLLEPAQEEMPWMSYRIERGSNLRSLTKYSFWYSKAMKALYKLLKEELTTGEDMIANGKFHELMVAGGYLDVKDAVYPYTKELLEKIVGTPAQEQPKSEQKPRNKYKKKRDELRAAEAKSESQPQAERSPRLKLVTPSEPGGAGKVFTGTVHHTTDGGLIGENDSPAISTAAATELPQPPEVVTLPVSYNYEAAEREAQFTSPDVPSAPVLTAVIFEESTEP